MQDPSLNPPDDTNVVVRPFVWREQVRITDINYGNHLGNHAWVGILHEARVRWLLNGGFSEISLGSEAGLIQRTLQVEYYSQVYHAEQLRIELSTTHIRKTSFDIVYTAWVEGRVERLALQATTGMSAFDYSRQKLARLPDRFVTFLEQEASDIRN